MSRRLATALVCLALTLVQATTFADDIDFQRDIFPIFQAKCLTCHGEKEREGGLKLLSRSDATARADSGSPAIIPGDSAGSELMHRIRSTDEDVVMPPEGTRVSAEQQQLLQRWIDAGCYAIKAMLPQ